MAKQNGRLFWLQLRKQSLYDNRQKENSVKQEEGNRSLQASQVGLGAGVSGSHGKELHIPEMPPQREDEQQESGQRHGEGDDGEYHVVD